MLIDLCIQRIRLFAQTHRLKRATLARTANIPEATIRKFGTEDWNPTAETLRRLEKIIPSDFAPDVTESEAAE